MANRKQLLGAFAIIIIIAITTVIYALLPPPSALKQMALTSDELGPSWGYEYRAHSNENASENYLANATYDCFLDLVVYSNRFEPQARLKNCSEWLLKDFNGTFLNVSLGEVAHLWYYGSAEAPRSLGMVFFKENVWCFIIAPFRRYYAKPWWINTTIWIAQLQLQKIDQYLASHPRAS